MKLFVEKHYVLISKYPSYFYLSVVSLM